MTNKRLTLGEMEMHFPDKWLLIVDCELSENTELLAGKVVAHSTELQDIRAVSGHYSGTIATHYTGSMPKHVGGYLL